MVIVLWRRWTIGAILYKTALVGAFGTIPVLASLLTNNGAGSLGKELVIVLWRRWTIGAILYETALVGAFGTIPALGSLLTNNGAGSFGKDWLSPYGGAGQSALSSMKRRFWD